MGLLGVKYEIVKIVIIVRESILSVVSRKFCCCEGELKMLESVIVSEWLFLLGEFWCGR